MFTPMLALALAACGPVSTNDPSPISHGTAPETDSEPATGELTLADDQHALEDADGDLVSNGDEGWGDADGDGVPNALDTDSDGDGLLDVGEAGDRDLSTPPVDSDGDGVADMFDLDSDDNCLPDAIEGAPLDGMPWNTDLAALPDHADEDNDGDHIYDALEIGDDCLDPPDTDGDGTPDHIDLDSDGDGVDDVLETALDTDRDGVPNFRDLDSDDDGLTDEEEAGGTLSCFGAMDSDGDCVPDFRDFDADNDGLLDGEEAYEYGTDHLVRDEDGDLATDMVEVLLGTDPHDGSSVSDQWTFLPHLSEASVRAVVDTTGLTGDLTATLTGDDPGFVTGLELETDAPDGAVVTVLLFGAVRETLHDISTLMTVELTDATGQTRSTQLVVVVPTMPPGVSCVPR